MSRSKIVLLFSITYLIFTMEFPVQGEKEILADCAAACTCDCSNSPCKSVCIGCCLDDFEIVSAEKSSYKNLPVRKAALIVFSAREDL